MKKTIVAMWMSLGVFSGCGSNAEPQLAAEAPAPTAIGEQPAKLCVSATAGTSTVTKLELEYETRCDQGTACLWVKRAGGSGVDLSSRHNTVIAVVDHDSPVVVELEGSSETRRIRWAVDLANPAAWDPAGWQTISPSSAPFSIPNTNFHLSGKHLSTMRFEVDGSAGIADPLIILVPKRPTVSACTESAVGTSPA